MGRNCSFRVQSVENNGDIYFKQSIIKEKSQKLCNNKIASARMGQWFNGDHSKNTYNFLRAKNSQRRLTAIGEFNGIKEVPEDLPEYYKESIQLENGQNISVIELYNWFIDKYSKFISNNLIDENNQDVTTEYKIYETEVMKADEKLLSTETFEKHNINSSDNDEVNINQILNQFMNTFKFMEIEIYNEFSLQHELGIYLRNNLPSKYKVQFERNVSFFELDDSEWYFILKI